MRRSEVAEIDIKSMIRQAYRLTGALVKVCDTDIASRQSIVNISRDLFFDHRACTPSPLVIPLESTLTAVLPTLTDSYVGHKAFSRDTTTISCELPFRCRILPL